MAKSRRKDQRKFKRIHVRFGPGEPSHGAIAIQITGKGAFLMVSRPIYRKGSRIVIQITTPRETHIVPAIVRHAKNVPPQLARTVRSGMGVEFISPPPEVEKFLLSL